MNTVLSLSRRFLLLSILLLAVGCAKPPPPPVPVAPPQKWGPGEVQDLRAMPQDLNAYLRPDTADRNIMPREQGPMRMESFRMTWLAPWHQGRPAYNRHQVQEIFARFTKSPGFGPNSSRNGPEFAAGLMAEAGLGSYPNLVRRAVTVRHTNQRGMPTKRPRFADPSQPGEGYPFDYLQHTSLPPGTPVLVTHATRDGAWVLTESALTFGWMPAADVAYVDEASVAPYATAPLAAVIKENTPLSPGVTAEVGSIFPMAGPTQGGELTVLVPTRETSGAVRLVPTRLAAGTATPMPMPMTPRNVAAVGNQFMGKRYGWGGLDGLRDCSALVHDLFVPFGLYLPRNSASQAGAGGAIPLADMGNDQKEQTIMAQGVPFASLIWMKGHILVYVGQWKGRPVVYHDIWGLRTFTDTGRDGRLVIGRAVVTTLRAGEEVPAVGPSHLLINRVRSMTILARP